MNVRWIAMVSMVLTWVGTAWIGTSAHADDASFHARYEAVRVALARDDDAAAERAAQAMIATTSGAVRASSERLASARGLEARRAAFAQLTERAIEAGLARGRTIWRCPMAAGRPRWLQASGDRAGNPYLGRAMPTCGEVVTAHTPFASPDLRLA